MTTTASTSTVNAKTNGHADPHRSLRFSSFAYPGRGFDIAADGDVAGSQTTKPKPVKANG